MTSECIFSVTDVLPSWIRLVSSVRSDTQWTAEFAFQHHWNLCCWLNMRYINIEWLLYDALTPDDTGRLMTAVHPPLFVFCFFYFQSCFSNFHNVKLSKTKTKTKKNRFLWWSWGKYILCCRPVVYLKMMKSLCNCTLAKCIQSQFFTVLSILFYFIYIYFTYLWIFWNVILRHQSGSKSLDANRSFSRTMILGISPI